MVAHLLIGRKKSKAVVQASRQSFLDIALPGAVGEASTKCHF